MGCPDIYYRRMLQKFCFALNHYEDYKKADKFLSESKDDILEKEADRHRDLRNIMNYAFLAGRVAEVVVHEAEKEGTDQFNACAGGYCAFEDFICGSEDDDE